MEKASDDDAMIKDALEHLDDAERGRAKARRLRAEAAALDAEADAETLAAERDLEKAKDHDDDEDDVKVRFRHLAEHEKVKFDADEDLSLQAIWDEAYVELEIARGERDVLQAPGPHGNPVSLMEHLALTLKQARRRELCDRDFEIAARTGGA
jgi:hypothetical protein